MIFLVALVAAATMTPMPPAPSGAPQMSVRTSDLDLRTRSGAERLRQRVDRAVVAMAKETVPSTGSFLEGPELRIARAAGRRQADAVVKAANGRGDPA